MTALHPIPAGVLQIEPGRSVPPASCMPATDQPASSKVPDRHSLPAAYAENSSGFVAGQHLGIVVSCGSSRHLVEHVKRRFESLGASAELLIPAQSDRHFDDRTEIEATHTLEEKPATDFDFVVVLPGLETTPHTGETITQWAHPLRGQAKPFAIGAQAAERLGVDIDNAAVFDVSTCDAFVQVCKTDAQARHASRRRE